MKKKWRNRGRVKQNVFKKKNHFSQIRTGFNQINDKELDYVIPRMRFLNIQINNNLEIFLINMEIVK